jgi:uncharacterized membrane protein YqiK
MGFPEMSHDDDAAHADAVRRLDASLDEKRRLEERRDEVRGTADETDAEANLAAGRAQAAARDAWLSWIERGA